MVVSLEDLSESDLVHILKEPKNSLVKQYQALFGMENVKLTFTDDALTAIAKQAMKRNTGARGLRSIMEGTLLDLMYDLPTLKDVKEIIINQKVIEKKETPVFVYETDTDKKAG